MVIVFAIMLYKTKSKDSNNVVNEPMVTYVTAGSFNPFYSLLDYSKSLKPPMILILSNWWGRAFRSVFYYRWQKISLNLRELAVILHISERTLQHYGDDEIIKSEYAEKAVEPARLYTRSEEVFGSMDKFKLWIKFPGVVFNGETPVSPK